MIVKARLTESKVYGFTSVSFFLFDHTPAIPARKAKCGFPIRPVLYSLCPATAASQFST